jgi:hypothetical protein
MTEDLDRRMEATGAQMDVVYYHIDYMVRVKREGKGEAWTARNPRVT